MLIDDAEATARTLMDDHGLEEWTFGFNRAIGRAGICYTSRKHISLSKPLTEARTAEEVTMTILHEIAHALVGPRHAHDNVWRRTFIELGGNGSRTYTASPAVEELQAKTYKYKTVCPNCGAEYTAHRKLSKFSERYCASNSCKHRNAVKETRIYLVWFEDTKFGPVRAHD